MKILNIRTIAGPNTFHNKPILLMTIDLGDRAEVSSEMMPGFTERLVTLLPGLDNHRCSIGKPGGFIERLRRGTYFGHIIEHAALEMSGMAGIEVGYGKTIYGGSPGVYKVAVRYRSEKGMRSLLESAVELVTACADAKAFEVGPYLERARELAEEEKFGPSTQAIIDAAERREIPWRRVNDRSLIEFGYGSRKKMIQATITGVSSDIGVDIAQDKDLTKAMLKRMSVPVPRGFVVSTIDEALEAFRDLGDAVAVKPLDGNHGNGVCLNLTTEADVREAFEVAREYSDSLLVEDYYTGKDFRLLIVGGKLIAASHREPAHVIGDGVSSISALIEIENRNTLRGECHEKPMTKIKIDRAALGHLERCGITLDSVPPRETKVQLRNIANLSKGGSATDVTDDVHPEIRSLCERVSRIVNLDVCGIDVIAEDISAPLSSQRGGVIEVNAAPGIRMHHYPTVGKPRDVGAAIIDHLFPNQNQGRIPIVSITGTNGKTTITRMIGHVLTEADKRVGMTTSAGIYLGNDRIADGDTTGPHSARMVLEDPWVDVAVLETARGGIMRRGLGYDWSDVGVITNIQPDHFGQDGIESLEDILKVKSLIAERVREGGTLILNAEDANVASLLHLPRVNAERKHVVFFAVKGQNAVMQSHLRKGGTGYYIRAGLFYENRRGIETPIGRVDAVPATISGTATYQIANALAAIAATRALGTEIDQIRSGLASFHPIRNNSGRGNFYRVGKGYIVVDYGHNPEAIRAVSDMAKNWSASRITGIISAPGDRSDEMIALSGEVAAQGFDKIIIREDIDLRGRPPGETAELLCDAARKAVPGIACNVELDEHLAIASAVEEMWPGEVIFFFYDDLGLVKETLSRLGAIPIDNLGELTETGLPRGMTHKKPRGSLLEVV